MQSITVGIILPLLCLANCDNMSLTQHILIAYCLNFFFFFKEEAGQNCFWLCDQYLEVSIPEQASGQGWSPGRVESSWPEMPGNWFILSVYPPHPVSLFSEVLAGCRGM